MSIHALIFDFDGTLAELNIDFQAMRREVEALAREMGYQQSWPPGYLLEQVRDVASGLGDGFRQRAMGLVMERELAAAAQGRLFNFTPGLLAGAARRGVRVAVITRNCGAAVRRVFPGVDQACQVFLPREAVVRPKPHPDHARAALESLGVAAAQAALVGDHPLDLECARAAGCLPVGVASGRVGAEELGRAGAALVLPDAAGLLQALGLA